MTDDAPRRVRELLSRLSAKADTRIPTTALGRFGKTAVTAVRTGAGVLAGRFRGHGGLDAELVEQMVLSMGELKGIAMKMGQILSYMDTTLSPEARELLSILQSRSQPTPFASIEQTLREDFGANADRLLAGLVREPVATASIGQVHRARLPDGAEVAVKVRHPGIESAIRADFKGAAVGKSLARVFAPGSDITELVSEAQARFLEECNYTQEAQRQRQFAALFASHPVLQIPAVYDEWCSDRVLTTAWHTGVGLDAFVRASTQTERDTAGKALYEFYLGSLYRHGLFNADPHPGNVLFDGGRVVVLDHGCVREFDRPSVRALASLSRAVRAGDGAQTRSALSALGVKNPDGPGFAVTQKLLQSFFAPVIAHGVRPMEAAVSLDMREVTRDKRSIMQLQLPGKLLFLFRIRFGLYAVLARLGAQADWNDVEAELIASSGVVASSDESRG